ncbi:MAG: LysR family transcriptional regulator [Acetobacter sp.]|nr:LysR family transcriptional regulator [Acetobacter sp.]
MNVRDLEYFIAVAECGSFSKASMKLGRPQPALSRHIRDLETDLRVPLLYRNGRGVVVTQAGELLQQLGWAIISQIHDAREKVRDFSSDQIGSAAIGMPASVSTILLAPLARSLRTAHAQAELRFLDGCNGDLLLALSSGSLDIALIYDAPGTTHQNLEALFSQPLYLIERHTSESGVPRFGDDVAAAELETTQLVLPGRRHGLRQIVDAWANRHGLEPRVLFECDSYSAILQVVASGLAATLLPAASLQREILSGQFRARLITKPSIYRTISLATSQSKPMNSSLVGLIKQSVANLKEEFLWPQNAIDDNSILRHTSVQMNLDEMRSDQ